MPSSARSGPLPPGSVIGILGGGQLGRMIALAAAELGYRCHVFTPEADAPAAQVTDRATVADWQDAAALAAFAAACDVVTYEFENIPARTAELVARRVPLRPGPGRARHLPGPDRREGLSRRHRRADDALARRRQRSGAGRGASPASAGRQC